MSATVPAIIWLASYPGSGNTWVRAILSNLLERSETPADINALSGALHAASRAWVDAYAGVRTSDLRDDEIEALRPRVYEAMAAEGPAPLFMKIHDRFGHTAAGEPIATPTAGLRALYIIRNPLDVAGAYAHHRGVSIDENIATMASESHAIAARRSGIFPQVRQHLGAWSSHVESWVNAPLDVHVTRYEDLKRDPQAAVAAIAGFAGLEHDTADLERAIRFSAFEELRRQEDAAGFKERSRKAERFFRRGESGAWRDELTPAQIGRIVDRHGAVMRRFGYLDAHGAPA